MSYARRASEEPTSRVRGRLDLDRNVTFAGTEALVAALQRGQPDARAAFFDAYEPHARRLLRHVLGPDPELTDILHDVFVNALRSIHTLREPSALLRWFTRLTVYTARKVLRSRRRRSWIKLFTSEEQEKAYEPLAADDQHTAQAVRTAYRALEQLHPDAQLVFTLHYVEGMTLVEVAAACELSLSTVKRRVARAREHFLAGIDPALAIAASAAEEP